MNLSIACRPSHDIAHRISCLADFRGGGGGGGGVNSFWLGI